MQGVRRGSEAKNDNESRIKAEIIVDGLGGQETILSMDHCAARLRLEINDMDKINESRIREANVLPDMREAGKNSMQVVVGTEVGFVASEIEKLK